MPVVPPQIVEPGFNDPNWSLQVECRTNNSFGKNKGCGARVRVKHGHLYLVPESEEGDRLMGRQPRDVVAFTCGCKAEVRLGLLASFNFDHEHSLMSKDN